MSIIKAIKQQLGLSVTPANNFTLDASADNGTMKLARNSGQDIMTVDTAGKVDFSLGIFGFSFGSASLNSGQQYFIKLPSWAGGYILQGGNGIGITDEGSRVAFAYPISFTQVPSAVLASNGDSSITLGIPLVFDPANTDGWIVVTVVANNAWIGIGVTIRVNWIAFGK